jgi:signal transduction histidine kinase
MAPENLAVLLIEDNPGDIRLVGEALSDTRFAHWRLSCRETLSEGLVLMSEENFAAVLLDLTLPDCAGGDTIARVHSAAPRIPIVVLTGLEDDAISRNAVKAGAQDFLVKGLFDGGLLSRSLFYAIERARLHHELEKARDDALQAAKLKSEFLAIISHEMRTPMNAILGPVELLIDTPLNPDQTELASTALIGARAMLTLIDDMLDYSRLAGGELRLREVAFEVTEALDPIVGDFSEAAKEKGLELQVRNEIREPLLLAGDPTRLGQILMNLVGNAIKFTDHGEVALTVTCEAQTAMDAMLRFSVVDTGIGITKDVERKLFAPFSQADGSTTRKHGGTGLGLAIAAQLVQRMGGQIGVTSTPGEGSTFYFTARLRKAPSSMIKLAVPRNIRGSTGLPTAANPRSPRPLA